MELTQREEFAALLRRRIADAEADAERAARVEADIDLSDACVGGKLDRTEAQQRRQAARDAAARRRAAIARLRAALARAGREDYGTCTGCGGAIPRRRLLADPAATRCVDCA